MVRNMVEYQQEVLNQIGENVRASLKGPGELLVKGDLSADGGLDCQFTEYVTCLPMLTG